MGYFDTLANLEGPKGPSPMSRHWQSFGVMMPPSCRSTSLRAMVGGKAWTATGETHLLAAATVCVMPTHYVFNVQIALHAYMIHGNLWRLYLAIRQSMDSQPFFHSIFLQCLRTPPHTHAQLHCNLLICKTSMNNSNTCFPRGDSFYST